MSADNGLVVMVVVVVVVVEGREVVEVAVEVTGPFMKMLVLYWPPPGGSGVVLFSFLLDALTLLELEEEEDVVLLTWHFVWPTLLR